MTALASSLKRIWSATNGVPDLTGLGTSGSRKGSNDEVTFTFWAREWILELIALARRTAPTVLVIACNLFR